MDKQSRLKGPVLVTGGSGYIGDSNADKEQPLTKVEKEEREEAFQKSYDLVNNAITDGIWSEMNVQDMRMNFHKLSSDQQEEIHSKLFPAINRGEIKMETHEIF